MNECSLSIESDRFRHSQVKYPNFLRQQKKGRGCSHHEMC